MDSSSQPNARRITWPDSRGEAVERSRCDHAEVTFIYCRGHVIQDDSGNETLRALDPGDVSKIYEKALNQKVFLT